MMDTPKDWSLDSDEEVEATEKQQYLRFLVYFDVSLVSKMFTDY